MLRSLWFETRPESRSEGQVNTLHSSKRHVFYPYSLSGPPIKSTFESIAKHLLELALDHVLESLAY